jgi:large subunit ribosomal protein L3
MARKGILGKTLGMTQVFDANARVIPVTVITAGPCPVVQVRTPERDGYSAVQMGYGRAKRPNRPLAGHFRQARVTPTRYLMEVDLDAEVSPGDEITVDQFAVGEHVDVTARSKGKGFTGTVKRHGFGTQGATHGVHKVHRKPGAIGACATPSRVLPGKKMAGRHGNQRVTESNLEVVRVDPERNLLLVRGAVPGGNGAIVLIRDAAKARTGGES